ncbi:hypothetical protein [Cupriavidus sp. USMAHM13]|uniref:hypothetical protein n=1 Tax=Cupriavidus sp. USMAHM13 TaxID=1389192 RepID=UPI0012EAC864|nr:hypothetical protein [Cupriavidus sp. USMAHM13]
MLEVIVGRFPPPIGGVSVFVQRKFESLKDHGAASLDFGNKAWFRELLGYIFDRNCVFLLNSANLSILAVFFFLGLLPRTVLYDHNASRHFWKSRYSAFAYRFFIGRLKEVRVVHSHLIDGYAKRGFMEKVVVESPFLPPRKESRGQILETYPDDVLNFINDRDAFRVVSAAWRYNVDANGFDVYGIATVVGLLRSLRTGGVNARLLLAFAEFNESDMPKALLHEIRTLRELGALVILDGQRELWPVFESANLFLRLTSTDGESVSVLEALYFNCAVIASDVVPRPAEVVTYRYGDSVDLLNKVVENYKRISC